MTGMQRTHAKQVIAGVDALLEMIKYGIIPAQVDDLEKTYQALISAMGTMSDRDVLDHFATDTMMEYLTGKVVADANFVQAIRVALVELKYL